MVFDYENLLVIGVLFDLVDLREFLEIWDEKWGNELMSDL